MTDPYQRGYIEVDLDAIGSNIDHMADYIGRSTDIIAVIKADGYGHGAVPIGRELEGRERIRGFAVATAEEAFILRAAGIQKPVMVLGYSFPYSYEQMIRERIEFTIFREDTLWELSQWAKRLRIEAKVHIKVDTGMIRLGIAPDDEGMAFVRKAAEAEGIVIEGILTHFAKADESDKTSANRQLRQFQVFCDRVEGELHISIPVKHCSNSAGIIDMKEADMNAVRPGIALYGLWPSDEVSREHISLTPALSFRSRIVWIREVEAGTPVSYGGTYTTGQRSRIATVPIGYADGYPRSLSNRGYVLVKGQKAPVVGRVCMDYFMIDVTGIDEIAEGEPVTLIGTDRGAGITADELGYLSGRFNYELVCDLGKRIPRIYTKGGVQVYAKDYFQDFL